jgi:hypothetical protein
VSRVVIDSDMQEKLGNLTEPLEVCNADGRVIAYLTPAGLTSDYASAQSPHSNAELGRREAEPARPLDEILADLEGRSPAE